MMAAAITLLMQAAVGTWLMRGSGATKDWRCFLDGVEVVGRGGLRPPEMERAGSAKFLGLVPLLVACCR